MSIRLFGTTSVVRPRGLRSGSDRNPRSYASCAATHRVRGWVLVTASTSGRATVATMERSILEPCRYLPFRSPAANGQAAPSRKYCDRSTLTDRGDLPRVPLRAYPAQRRAGRLAEVRVIGACESAVVEIRPHRRQNFWISTERCWPRLITLLDCAYGV